MIETSKVRLKKGIINLSLTLGLFLGIPSIFIIWMESGQFFGYIFRFTGTFKIAFIISGLLFATSMFFYGYWPFDSRKSLVAFFLGTIIVAIFFFNFVMFIRFDFTSETTTLYYSPSFLLSIIIVLSTLIVFSFFRILKLKPTEEDIERYWREHKPPSKWGSIVSLIIICVLFIVMILLIIFKPF